MKRLLLFIVTVFISCPNGQDTSHRDFWESLDANERIAFVEGVYSGLGESLKVMNEEAMRQRKQDRFWVPPFVHEHSARTLREYFPVDQDLDYTLVAGHLDAFYSNPDNAHIAVMSALFIIMLHQAGETRRANELLLVEQKKALKGR
ncbi:MAG: hypothetical protein V3U24_02185 [Candidatus Neomarinimicrobiota bacterium]